MFRKNNDTLELMSKKIRVRARTLDEEFNYLNYLFSKKKFFKENGYWITIPKNKLFQKKWDDDTSVEKLKDNEKVFFEEGVYDSKFYERSIEVIEKDIRFNRQILEKIDKWKNWGFKVFEKYEILLTAYGPGGSYDPENGLITMMVNEKGKFKKPPLETIIHEIIHIGVEESIIRRFNLTHWEKESLVDAICVKYFNDILNNYQVQKTINQDVFNLITKDNIENLPEIIEKFKNAEKTCT